MKIDLRRLVSSRLPLRLNMLAVLLDAGRPLGYDEILDTLARLGVEPRHGVQSLRRACAADTYLRQRPDGCLRVDRSHPDFARDHARLAAARARSPVARSARVTSPSSLAPDDERAADSPLLTRVRRCSREAPRLEATWLGSRRPMGALGVFDQEMDLLIWLDATAGRVRAFDIVPTGQSPCALAALLEPAIHDPLDGCAPGVPSLVAVDVTVGRLAVERTADAHGAEPVDRDVSPLDKVFEQLERELSSPVLSLAGVAEPAIRVFYSRCRALLAAAPWKGVATHETLRLDGVVEGPLHVLLVAASPAGFIVFLDEAAALEFLLRPRPLPAPVLSVRFHPARRVAAAAAAAQASGWRGDVVPLPLRLEGGEPRFVEAAELDLLSAVADAVSRLAFTKPFRNRRVAADGGREVRATWPLLASPFRRPPKNEEHEPR